MTNSKDIKKILGDAIKELRTQKGITQERLAEFLGIQPPTIAKIETGKTFISSELFAKLCDYFNVEPYVFFLRQGQTYTPQSLDHISEINSKLNKIYDLLNTMKH